MPCSDPLTPRLLNAGRSPQPFCEIDRRPPRIREPRLAHALRVLAVTHVEGHAHRFELSGELLESCHFEPDVIEHPPFGGLCRPRRHAEVDVDAREIDRIVSPPLARCSAERFRIPRL